MAKYDSAAETKKHIQQVGILLQRVAGNLRWRRMNHDKSKLGKHEKPMYDKFTPRLRALTYGSNDYKETLKEMGTALRHHYEVNSHHPEHYWNGVNGMSLLDIIEMLADWKAAAMRHANGDLAESLKINRARFGISEQLAKILENTVRELGW